MTCMPYSARTICAAVFSMVLPGIVGAQQPASPQPASLPPSVPADSMGPEHTWQRYTTPLECAFDRKWGEREYWRHRRPDTTYIGTEGRADQSATVAASRACVERVTAVSVAARDQLILAQAYLAAEQFDSARKTLNALAASTKGPPRDKAWVLYEIITVYLAATRPLLDDALQYMARLDAMGVAVAPERMMAHQAVAQEAARRDSVSLQAREIAAALRASKEMTGDTRKEYGLHSADVYEDAARLKVRQNDPAGAMATIAEGRNTLVPLRPFVASSFDSQMPFFVPIGQSAPPIQATRWFNTGATGDRRPVAGKPTLLVFATVRCSLCQEGYGVLRRLSAKYAKDGLDITLIARTTGYFAGRLLPADTEMIKISDYFLKDLKLPVALSVWRTDFGRRDDHRLIIESAPNERAYQPYEGYLMGFLVTPNGTVRLAALVNRHSEIMLDHVIGELLQSK